MAFAFESRSIGAKANNFRLRGKMRIAKFMAACGVASRRACGKIILEGKVKVNGSVLNELGRQIDPEKDIVVVSGKRITLPREHVYIMLNKPVGCVSTCDDDRGRRTVLDCLKGVDARVFPVGRLDFNTEGLLLLTNDGEVANKLTHPSREVTKRYYCVVGGMVTPADVKALERGVMLEDGKTAPARIKIFKATPERSELTIIIHEGRNRQVRRMFEAIDKEVLFLKRISEGNLNLGNLKRGEFRFLTEEEIEYLKSL